MEDSSSGGSLPNSQASTAKPRPFPLPLCSSHCHGGFLLQPPPRSHLLPQPISPRSSMKIVAQCSHNGRSSRGSISLTDEISLAPLSFIALPRS